MAGLISDLAQDFFTTTVIEGLVAKQTHYCKLFGILNWRGAFHFGFCVGAPFVLMLYQATQSLQKKAVKNFNDLIEEEQGLL